MSVVTWFSRSILLVAFLELSFIHCQQGAPGDGPSQVRLFQPATTADVGLPNDSAGASRSEAGRSLRSSYYAGPPSERIFDLGLLGKPYYGNNRGYGPQGYYPQGGYYPPQGYYPQAGGYPSTGYPGYYPNNYPGTNTLGGSPYGPYGGGVGGGYGGYSGYSGYGGYGGFGGNGGLQSYLGYNSGNYYGTRNLGYGYYSGSNPAGITTSSLVSGYRGYN